MSAPLRFLHFEVETDDAGRPRELGRGAMGVTYKAFDTNLRSPVALKVIAPSLLADGVARERFLREARTAASLRHQNVATVLFLGEIGDEVFYAMEFVEGQTLQELVRETGPLHVREVIAIALEVVKALTSAHRAGLVHRDIKPSNIMVCKAEGEWSVKLIDFGLAKLVTGEFTGQTLAQASAAGFQGTPHFASPEQINGEDADIRSDIYSLGVTLFAALTGRAPFEGSLAQVLSKHVSMPPPLDLLPDEAAPLKPVLDRMLAKEPGDRYQAPAELRAALEAIRPEVGSLSEDEGLGTIGMSDVSQTERQGRGKIFAGKYKMDGRLCVLAHATIHYAERLDGGASAGLVFTGESGWEHEEGSEELIEQIRAIPAKGLIAVVALERDAGRAALVTEWVGGPTLFDLLKRRKMLSAEEALVVLSGLAQALDALERAGVAIPQIVPGDVVLSTREAMDQPLDEIDGLRAAFLPVWPEGRGALGAQATLVAEPFAGAKHTPTRALGVIAYEVFGGMHGDGGFRWTPLPSLSAHGNAALRSALEGTSDLASAIELLDALRPGAKAPRRAVPRKAPVVAPAPLSTVSARPSPAPLTAEPAPAKPASPPWLLLGGGVVALMACGLGAAAFFLWPRSGEPTVGEGTETLTPTAEVSALPSPTATPTPDPATELLAKADEFKRRDDFAGALALYAQAADVGLDAGAAKSEMEKLSAFLRSEGFRMTPERLVELRPGLELAAERDVISAQMLLGEALRGEEPRESLKWFRRAASNGQTEAMTQAGLMLASGVGTDAPDFHEAVAWFQQGAGGGDIDAMVALADCYMHGKGTAVNLPEAVSLLQNAVVFRHPRAFSMLGDLTRKGVPGVLPANSADAVRLFTTAMEFGDYEGQANLGVMLVNGWGVERNPRRAFELWKEGAEGGEPVSMYFYAVALEGGLVGEPDEPAARKWFINSARLGNQMARDWCTKNRVDFRQ